MQDTFRRFAEEKIRPVAEHVHRENSDVPEDIIGGLAEMGAFGLSVPEEYGGWAGGGESDYLGMVVATEELSRGSLGIGGSLITRPEILDPRRSSGAAPRPRSTSGCPSWPRPRRWRRWPSPSPTTGPTSPSIKVTATAATGPDDEDGYVINGVKTWCTFGARADVLMLLARTDPDRSHTHRGLSLFVVPKPRGEGHGFAFQQDPARRLRRQDGGPGHRHHRLPRHALLRGRLRRLVGAGRRASSARRAASGAASTTRWRGSRTAGCRPRRGPSASCRRPTKRPPTYANDRSVFGRSIGDYQLTQVKLARMAFLIQAGRQFAYAVARLMAKGQGTVEASMVKAYVCKAAEWVTREAMQIHGGYGYAEEYPVSRLYVDARVLSIFEGADETLCLKVIARRLIDQLN